MGQEKLNSIHPGEVLVEEFLKPMGLSPTSLAADISVAVSEIHDIVAEKRRMTADIALRLARYFDMSPKFWLGLQMDYDLDCAMDALEERLDSEVKSCQVARI